MRIKSLVVSSTLILGSLVGDMTPAHAASSTPVLDRRHGEFQPVKTDEYLAWERNYKRWPNKFNVFVRPDGKKAYKVNARDTKAANGGIYGDTLVYQQFSKGKSDIFFFDLSRKDRDPAPKIVNTNAWEYWPSLYGQWLLYGRLLKKGSREIVLYDLINNRRRVLYWTSSQNGFLSPGQVNGNYVVWSRCRPSGDCDSFIHDMSDRSTKKIPNPHSAVQRSPSVTPEGTVYFVRSARKCGRDVRLMRYPLGGSPELLEIIPKGRDVTDTYAFAHAVGHREVLYERTKCGDQTGSDVWKTRDTPAYKLRVEKERPRGGSVVSDPSGIDCGETCSAVYTQGTIVELTAEPSEGWAFSTWRGACIGTEPDCSVRMNFPESVTAVFEKTNELIVTKAGNGSGSVTSDPAGIDCGTDCTESLPADTVVSLTATPAEGSSFAGWSGACVGADPTCTFDMDADATVTATFQVSAFAPTGVDAV